MHLPEPDPVGALQTRNQAKDATLLFPLEVGLETYEIIQRASQIILPQLDNRVRSSPCPRIDQANRAQRPKRQGVPATPGQHLDGQTGLKEPPVFLFETVRRCLLCAHQRRDKPLVL